MRKLRNDAGAFKNSGYVAFATDVTFQQSNGPSESMAENSKYLSDRDKLYG